MRDARPATLSFSTATVARAMETAAALRTVQSTVTAPRSSRMKLRTAGDIRLPTRCKASFLPPKQGENVAHWGSFWRQKLMKPSTMHRILSKIFETPERISAGTGRDRDCLRGLAVHIAVMNHVTLRLVQIGR